MIHSRQTLPNIASKRNMICSVPLCNVSRSRLWAFPLALILCGSWRTVALSAQRKLRSMQRASLPTFPWLTTTRKRRHSTSFPPLSKRCFRPFLPRFGNVLTSGGLGGGKKKANLPHEGRSEEHTSELQSLMRISYAVFGLKKKKQTQTQT